MFIFAGSAPAHERVEEGVDAAVSDGDHLQSVEEMVKGLNRHPSEDPIDGVQLADREEEVRKPTQQEDDPDCDEHAHDGNAWSHLFALLLLLVSTTKQQQQ